jgi:uracil-DNA glycosylase family 4
VSDEQDAERAALRQELGEIASSLRAYVEWQRDAGTIGFPRLPKTAQPGAAMQSSEPEPITAAPVADVPVPPPPPAPPAAPAAAAPEPQPLPVIEPRARLPQLGAEVAACRKCGLCSKRKRAAFGRGDVGAQVMFVGEAPGQEDDEQGRPFVGRAGQLLDKMIAAMKLTEAEVYIGNVIKCRPPGNRRPDPPEIAACMPYLHEQIALVRPKILVALGNVAIGAILETEDGVDKLRGGWRLYRGQTLVLPTYHPSRLLRDDAEQPEIRRRVWEDLQLAMNEMARLKA